MRQLVDLQGGRIEVQSEGHNRGARFTVWLPLYVVSAPDTRAPSVVEPAPAGMPMAPSELQKLPLAGLRILVVDDGRDAVDAMHELLEMEGADAEVALSGEEALGLARRIRFDVVVSDIAMPGMDGMTLLRKLRELPGYAAVPAIACSGFNRRQDVEQAHAAGYGEHLSKPIGVRDLIDAILRQVARAKA